MKTRICDAIVTYSTLILSLFSFTSVLAADTVADVFTPADAEMALIEHRLSERMLDPSSTIVSDVLASEEVIGGDQMAWVCGNVRGKNGLGGYSQPTPFMGALIEAADGAPDFLVIAVASQDAAEQHRVLSECLSRLK